MHNLEFIALGYVLEAHSGRVYVLSMFYLHQTLYYKLN